MPRMEAEQAGEASGSGTGSARTLTEGVQGHSSSFGSIEPYIHDEGDDFEEYLERMESFLDTNRITDSVRKRDVFITFAGKEIYKALKAAIQPRKVRELTYKEMTQVLTNKYARKKSRIGQRFKFHNRVQAEGESIEDFAQDLQFLAQSCEYGNALDESLRDRFVCGLRNTRIQTKLIDDDQATFDQVLRTALNMELTEESVKMIHPLKTENIAKIAHVKQKAPSKQRKGGTPYIKCYNCNKWGSHVAAECKVKKKSSRKEFSRRESSKKEAKKKHEVKNLQYIASDSSDSSEGYRIDRAVHSLRLGSILKEGKLRNHTPNEVEREGSVSDPVYIEVSMGKYKIKMEIDCGAHTSVMHVDDYKKYFSEFPLRKCALTLSVVTGDDIAIVGQIKGEIKIKFGSGRKQKFEKMRIVIISCAHRFIPLCGRDWISRIYPQWRNTFKCNAIKEKENKSTIIVRLRRRSAHPVVFY
ncbi:uncharacterized protein LOC129796641 isoform X1 [Lutzomyia longipalpis]|uniref:uncharacterized protein LOC129790656 isoform X2 n=1 Tax=Lutzomyia longipalpis TaxID=7200 RepID=UPI002483A716|nr:uncharacterized protein LOC129790656 isoform X2 [Lutzomyia longipalpis]XP_055694718.1 uncharacterized protein LOC129796641 isoform X1 [Lutzomyia longipalpis]